MKVRKGVSVLKVRGAHHIEHVSIELPHRMGFLQMLIVDGGSLARIKATFKKDGSGIDRPLYAALHPRGIEIFPAPVKATNVRVRYSTLHEI